MTRVQQRPPLESRLEAAIALRHAGRTDKAEAEFRALTKLAPQDWRPWANLGQLLRDTDRAAEAVGALQRAIAMDSAHAPVHAVLGECLHQIGRLRWAKIAMQRAFEHGLEGNPDLWILFARNARALGDMPGALAALERAGALVGNEPTMRVNLGVMLSTTGRFDEALTQFEAALAQGADPDAVAVPRGYTLLAAGRVAEGWADLEQFFTGGPRGEERQSGLERWTPAHAGSRVRCYREQGLGEEILFASCLGDLAEANDEVVYETDPRLLSLFARSFPNVAVREQIDRADDGNTTPGCDVAIPIGSLPMHFRETTDRFERARRSYLTADPARITAWRQATSETTGPKVAISWRAERETAERRLEYTQLGADWGPIFALPGITWISAQYDDCEAELQEAEQRFGVSILRWAGVDYANDIETVAALISVCDLVLAPRNAIAMLAGALGLETVMLGNRSDWSDLGTDGSPWFPSVQLAGRRVDEEWDGVIAAAAARVAGLHVEPAVEPAPEPDKEGIS